jgi:hypothetical protein
VSVSVSRTMPQEVVQVGVVVDQDRGDSLGLVLACLGVSGQCRPIPARWSGRPARPASATTVASGIPAGITSSTNAANIYMTDEPSQDPS